MERKKSKKPFGILLVILFLLLLAGAGTLGFLGAKTITDLQGNIKTLQAENKEKMTQISELETKLEELEQQMEDLTEKQESTDEAAGPQKQEENSEKSSEEAEEDSEFTSDAGDEAQTVSRGLVAIDPGHQGYGVDMSALEPNAPGSSEMKAKATTGTEGRFTGIPEFQLNLDISLMLADELRSRGFEVLLAREDNETAISNAERAQKANDAGADFAIRIHANGADDSSVNGALAMVGSASNPYIGHLYDSSYKLAEKVLNSYCAETGLASQGIVTTDSMTGLNWSTIPTMILEMGFMTNESDDTKMADSEFRKVMVKGIADGIEAYANENLPNAAQ